MTTDRLPTEVEDYNDFVQQLKLSPRLIAANTAKQADPVLDLFHGLYALQGEVAEALDALKKVFFYGQDLAEVWENLNEEFGDMEYYRSVAIEAMAELHSITAEEFVARARQGNMTKLSERYNKGRFALEDARARRDKG